MAKFVMPSLGADMEDGKLVEWLVKPGAALKRGDIIAVVETQKGAIEIENFDEGTFDHPLVEIGETVPVGTPIAEIRSEGEPATAERAELPARKAEAPEPEAPKPESVAPPKTVPVVGPAVGTVEGRIRISPASRRYAAEHGLNIASISGSGPGGEIQLRDVQKTAEAAGGKPSSKEASIVSQGENEERLSGMRAAIAAAMSRSKREIPHYYLVHSIDLTAVESWLASHNANLPPEERILLGALLVKAVALSARKFPEFNGHFADGVFSKSHAVHTGVAINIRGTGLVAPAIHNADSISVADLMAAMRDLVSRVRAGRFRSSELSDPTITISSLGERGVETLYGVIYPPQVAIVGFGTPTNEVRAFDGMIGVRRILHVTLAGDHRVSDGHRGALFLVHIEHLLQEPEKL